MVTIMLKIKRIDDGESTTEEDTGSPIVDEGNK
jgi:hypothetical protein